MPVSKSRKKKGKSRPTQLLDTSVPRAGSPGPFNVLCLIAGPELPEVELAFEPHEIKRVSAHDVEEIDQGVPVVEMEIRNEPHVVSVFPGYSQMKTEWMMNLKVRGEDIVEAQIYAEKQLLPRVLAVLDTLTSSWRPFRAKVVDVLDSNTGEHSYIYSSNAIPVRRREELLPADSQILQRRLAVLEQSDVGNRASVLMRQAVDLLDDGRETFNDLAVLRMFTAIEGIVADVVR